jgi:hypothetical protein
MEIGRWLKAEFDSTDVPVTRRLAELVNKLENDATIDERGSR